MDKALQILKSVYGYDSFRPLQKDVVDHVVSGRDALVLMPTGGGKSICYQIPAMMLEGIAIVVSPLMCYETKASGAIGRFFHSNADSRPAVV